MTFFALSKYEDENHTMQSWQASFLNGWLFFGLMGGNQRGTHVTLSVGIKKFEVFVGLSLWEKAYETDI